MSDLETMLRFVPKDGIFRPRECFFLTLLQLTQLLNRGLIEMREIGGREFYRAVQDDRGKAG